MSKSTANKGKLWTAPPAAEAGQLVRGDTPTRVGGLKLGRSEDAVLYAR
ncbi:MAG: hypothetical protein ACHQ9S_19275 [Candidatus Binatia bacterium]